MTKEQFNILLKAKNIMVEQALSAINFLKNQTIEDAVNGHYNLYVSAYNNANFKVSNIAIKSLVKYLPKIKVKEIKALALSVMASDAVNHENYNETIDLYYEYKKLELADAKLDYLFDIAMFNILVENKIYSKYKKVSQSIANNPYLYEIDGYHTVLFFYKNILINQPRNDLASLEYYLAEMKTVIDTNRYTEYPDRCKFLYEISLILVLNFQSKKKQNQHEVYEKYLQFTNKYCFFESLFSESIDAHISILKTIVKGKHYDYAIERLNQLLGCEYTNKSRVSIFQLLTECYKHKLDSRYVETLESLNNLLYNHIQNNQEIVNEGLLNSVKFYDTQRSYTEIQKQYEIDKMTGCYSRNVFYKKTIELFSKTNMGTLVFLDLDNLKYTNDVYSHSTGDEYLKIFASKIFEMIDDSYQLFRYGGDEFVLTTNEVELTKIEALLVKIIRKFNEPIQVFDANIYIKFSAGIATYPYDGETIDEVISCADKAMYIAKKKGGGYYIYQQKK
jgi:diguanylate cyclase (GGDEF)-like protein